MHAYSCKQGSWQLCLGCGAKVCGCYGTARGQCPECYVGLLTNFYRIGHKCGYKGCNAHAVAAVPRVGFACAKHAAEKAKYSPDNRNLGDGKGYPTYHTQSVLQALGIEFPSEQI